MECGALWSSSCYHIDVWLKTEHTTTSTTRPTSLAGMEHAACNEMGHISLMIFGSKFESNANSTILSSTIQIIAAKFCTCHASIAGVACAKCCCNLMAGNWNTIELCLKNHKWNVPPCCWHGTVWQTWQQRPRRWHQTTSVDLTSRSDHSMMEASWIIMGYHHWKK